MGLRLFGRNGLNLATARAMGAEFAVKLGGDDLMLARVVLSRHRRDA
jgi:hypothetical protein